ncbi:Methionine--tRNA ligase [bacterium HR19]|nr:Methionine--tRNA ligase [bacterium HR19]
MSYQNNMKFYVTTPIYYVNDKPHIGHAYTTVAADIIAKFKRQLGYKVFFLTGTDEHGRKIEKAAEERGISPKELADEMHLVFKKLWQTLNISYNKFIRTTDKEHEEAVIYFWKKMKESGAIYKGKYVGWYCVPCESFIPSSQVEDVKCPTCGRPVEILEEESYFFSVGKYKQKLKEYIENSGFVKPDFRKREVLNALEDLGDISITRSRERVKWGIPVPDDERFTIYVWVDALINYLSGVGYPSPEVMDFWPADIHLIGKDILKFHAIYWPMFLMSAGLELPKMVFAHGWWKIKGEKMSKSLKNIVDPFEIVSVFGADALRYFMFRETPFGQDGDFSEEGLRARYENELAKDIGNLFLRLSRFAESNFSGKVRKISPPSFDGIDIESLFLSWKSSMENVDLFKALGEIFNLVSYANRYIDQNAPWSKIKINREEAEKIIFNCAYLVKVIVFMLYPFCPETSKKVAQSFGIEWIADESKPKTKEDVLNHSDFFNIKSTGILFPKIGG